jgi:hypothetical protein
VPPKRELLNTIGLGHFGREPAGSELIAYYRDIEQPDPVDFVTTPVSIAYAAKDFYVPNQALLSLVLCCLGQYGPIVT